VYGTSPTPFPERVVCLSADTAEVAFAVGAGDRVVGVPGTVRRPAEARERPRIGGFTTFRLDRILALRPDLALACSDLQADVVRELVRAAVPVVAVNPRSIRDIFQAILVVGGALGCEGGARAVVADLQDEIRQVREFSSAWTARPRVYVEEWDAPPVAGIRWVSELVEIAGGQDVFPELRERPAAAGRVVDPAEVVRRDPEVVVASWCGKPVDLEAIRRRPGWAEVSAVRRGQVYALPSEDLLVPGPSIVHGLRALHELVQASLAADPPV
jgi:iron complex transport system substrate-binding protein